VYCHGNVGGEGRCIVVRFGQRPGNCGQMCCHGNTGCVGNVMTSQ